MSARFACALIHMARMHGDKSATDTPPADLDKLAALADECLRHQTKLERAALFASVATSLAAAGLLYFVLQDLVIGGLGTSNGKLVSLLDSVSTCYGYRV